MRNVILASVLTLAACASKKNSIGNTTGSSGSSAATSSTGSALGAGSSTGSGAAQQTLSATVSGLDSLGLVLQNNGGDDLSVTSDGTFSFSPLQQGVDYAVTVSVQPAFDSAVAGASHNQNCVVSQGSGTVGSSDITVSVICHDNTVTPFYSQGANWLDYVANDAGGAAGSDQFAKNGTTSFAASNTTCVVPVFGTVHDYYSCLHGGEYRVFTVFGEKSCAGLSAKDDARASTGALQWRCLPGTTPSDDVRFASFALVDGAGLADLIDFSHAAFKAIIVSVSDASGQTLLRTDPIAPWWNNTIEADVTAAGIGDDSAPGLVNPIHIATQSVALAANINPAHGQSALVMPADGSVVMSLANTGPVIVDSGDNQIWLEGIFDASNVTIGAFTSSLSQFVVANNISVLDPGGYGIDWSENTGCLIRHLVVRANANTSSAIKLQNGGANRINGVTMAGGGVDAMMIANEVGDIIDHLRAWSTSGAIATLPADDLIASDVVLGGAPGLGIDLTGSGNWFADITVLNAFEAGVFDGLINSEMLQFAALNTSTAFSVGIGNTDTTGPIRFANVATLGDVNDFLLNDTSGNTFTAMKITHALNDSTHGCHIGDTHAGVTPASQCNFALSGQTNTGHASVNGAATLVGEVPGDSLNGTPGAVDGTNDTDKNNPVKAAISDWFRFISDFRGWALDATADNTAAAPFPDASILLPCPGDTSKFCHIWDTRLATNDTGDAGNPALLGANAVPDANLTIIHTFTTGTKTYLQNAVEIFHDGIGNDNALCESGETCLFTPNIGSYQGEGALVCMDGSTPPCALLADGTLTGITLLRYEMNGVAP